MSQRGLRAQSWQRSSYLQPGSKVHKRHRRRCAPIRRYGALASCSRSRATLSGLVRALAGSSRLSLCERFGSAFPLHAVQLSREVPADPVSFLPAPPAKRLVPRYVGLSGNIPGDTGGHTSNVIKPVATNEAGLDSLLRTSLVQRAATIGPSYVRPDIFSLVYGWTPLSRCPRFCEDLS
jgi:hypothetical protein